MIEHTPRPWTVTEAYGPEPEREFCFHEIRGPDGKHDGSFASLIDCYQTDPESPYRTVEYASRQQYDKGDVSLDLPNARDSVR